MTSNLGRSDPYQCMTEPDLVLLKQQPRGYQFQTIDKRVRDIERVNRRIYAELGLLVLWVESEKLYQEGCDLQGNPWQSMEAWLSDCCPYSRSYALDARTKIRILRDSGTPLDKLQEIPRANIVTLSLLPPALQRDETVLADAQVLSEDAFKGKIIREHPEAHLEPQRRVKWQFDKSAWEVVDEAIHRAMAKWDCNQQAAIEGIFAEWLVADKAENESPVVGGRMAHA